MAVGALVRYEKFPGIMLENAGRKWAETTAGAFMFGLASSSYTPDTAHATAVEVTGFLLGQAAPIVVANRSVVYTPANDKTWYASDPANFGATVTITAKYLLCLMPVTPGTYDTTAKLCWYMDLNVGAGLSLSSTNSDFIINMPANGWFSIP